MAHHHLRRKARGGRDEHRVAALAADAADARQVILQPVPLEVRGDEQLVERGRVQVRTLLRQDESLEDGRHGRHPADAQAGTEHLREGAREHHAAVAVE